MKQISKYLCFLNLKKLKIERKLYDLYTEYLIFSLSCCLFLNSKLKLYRTIHQNISYVLRPHSTIFLCQNCYKKRNLGFNTANCSFEIHLEKNPKDLKH